MIYVYNVYSLYRYNNYYYYFFHTEISRKLWQRNKEHNDLFLVPSDVYFFLLYFI